MFVRELKNRSGSVSIQIINNAKGEYRVVKTVGFGTERREIDRLKLPARQEIERLEAQPSLFHSEDDGLVEGVMSVLSNAGIRTAGSELIFGRIYDHIGFGRIKEELFRHLVISRIAFPLSKLKTAEYHYRYQGEIIDVDAVYRFPDRQSGTHQATVEQIAFAHARQCTRRSYQCCVL